MYRLEAQEPAWKELIPAIEDRPAVEVLFPALPSAKAMRKARDAYRDSRVSSIAAGLPPMDALFDAGEAFSRELVRWSILGWRGIGGSDEQPVEPTQDRNVLDDEGNVISVERGTISAFLAEPRLMEAADREFVLPFSIRDAEKNGYAGSSSGTSEVATPADAIATAPAMPSAPDAAPTAPTGSTHPKRKLGKKSGS